MPRLGTPPLLHALHDEEPFARPHKAHPACFTRERCHSRGVGESRLEATALLPQLAYFGCAFVVELPALNGRAALPGIRLHSLIRY